MSTRIPDEALGSDFVYIVMYRLRLISDDEKKQWIKEWAVIRKSLPKGIKIVTEAGHAFGTEFTGFTVFEGPFSQFDELVTVMEEHTYGLVEKTWTVIGTKGLVAPTSLLKKIVKSRPID